MRFFVEGKRFHQHKHTAVEDYLRILRCMDPKLDQ